MSEEPLAHSKLRIEPLGTEKASLTIDEMVSRACSDVSTETSPTKMAIDFILPTSNEQLDGTEREKRESMKVIAREIILGTGGQRECARDRLMELVRSMQTSGRV